jgi:hypothetical protein
MRNWAPGYLARPDVQFPFPDVGQPRWRRPHDVIDDELRLSQATEPTSPDSSTAAGSSSAECVAVGPAFDASMF